MYSILISDKYENDSDFYNELIFNFESKEDAINFAKQIINISNYSVEIITHIKGE